jgi:hypothetical protein
MKKKIADFLYNFIIKNHTHRFDVITPDYNTFKCRICGLQENRFFVTKYEQKYFKKWDLKKKK